MSVAETLGYRSPLSKLLRFFRRSRDQWKSKCKVAKEENKSLKIRLAKMTESRDRWKAKAQSAQKILRGGSTTAQSGNKKPRAVNLPRPEGRRYET